MFSLIHPWGRHFPLLFIVSKKWAGTGAFNGERLVHVIFFFSEITLVSFHAIRAGTVNLKEASLVCRLVAYSIKGTSGIPENMFQKSIWWAFLELYVGHLEYVF